MDLLQSLIMGIIQGLTEFLPVSSTAHLLIGQKLLGIPTTESMFSFLVIIQLGTILSLCIYFGGDLWKMGKALLYNMRGLRNFQTLPQEARLGWYILLATIPALLAGFLLKDLVERLFANQILEAAIRLLTASFLMFLAERIGRFTRRMDSMTWKDALIIGLFQVIAVFPGASRSGTTISAGLMRNLDRPSAARFAFLMSIPVMVAAGAYESVSIIQMTGLNQFLPLLMTGFFAATITGWLAIRWFMGFLSKHSLKPFAIYCLVTGLVCLVLWII
jgi:undecaprenyl-diphosphatase